MRIVIDNADNTEWSINIYYCNDPQDMNIATLITALINTNYLYIQRHHGDMAGTITDLVEHINDGVN